MNDSVPDADVIARLASRIYNEGPKRNGPTQEHSEAMQPSHQPGSVPAMTPQMPAPSRPPMPAPMADVPMLPTQHSAATPHGLPGPVAGISSNQHPPTGPLNPLGVSAGGSPVSPQAFAFPASSVSASQFPASPAPTFGLPGSSGVPSSFSSFTSLPSGLPGAISTGLPAGLPGASELAGRRATVREGEGLRTFVEKIRARHTDAAAPFSPNVKRPQAEPRDSDFGMGVRPFDISVIRRDFPALHQEIHGKPLVWLDNAATTHKPQSVIDALSHFYAHDNSNIHRAAHTLAGRSTDGYEGAREKVQKFIGASSPQEIVFARGTTEAINLVAQTYGRKFLQPGDEIVLSILEHHANIVPWQMVAKEKGAVIRVIPVNDRGEIKLEDYQAMLGPRTKLVSLTHASNGLGTILPVAEMTHLAKRYNARVLIDGAQSVAHLPVNVQDWDCDFFAFSGHKIFAPTGIGALYAKADLLELMPPWQGGGSMIRDVTFEETIYSGPPAKFEAGTPSIGDAIGLGAAIDYVNSLGLQNIGRHEHDLLEYGTHKLSRIPGLQLIGTARDKVGVLSFVLPGKRTEDIGRLLDLEGIAVRAGHHCAQPSLRRFGVEKTVRPSLALYNTKDDLDRLAAAILHIQHVEKLQRS